MTDKQKTSALFAAEQFGCEAAANKGPRIINRDTMQDIAYHAKCDVSELAAVRQELQDAYNAGYAREMSHKRF